MFNSRIIKGIDYGLNIRTKTIADSSQVDRGVRISKPGYIGYFKTGTYIYGWYIEF